MRGAAALIEFIGFVLFAIFVIGVVVILLMTFLPDLVHGNYCRQKQAQTINAMFADASSTRSHTIKAFVVESCVEYIDFAATKCSPGARVGSTGVSRCYEVLYVGESKGNCADAAVACDEELLNRCIEGCGIRDAGLRCKDKCTKSNCAAAADYCSTRRGLFAPIPGGPLAFEISPYCDDLGCRELRYGPGKYSVEIGPYSIKFLKPSN